MDSYLPWRIGDLSVLIQNVYIYEFNVWDPFRVPETWIFIHFFIPHMIGYLTTSVRNGLLLCYMWETTEHNLMGLFMNKNIFGTETAMDSVVGDILQGFTGVLWAHVIKRALDIPVHYLWARRTGYQRFFQILLVVLLGASANLTTIILVVDPNKPVYYASLEDWFSRPINTFAVGFWLWLTLGYLVMWFFEYTACADLPEMAPKIHKAYFISRVIYTIFALACFTLWIPTYYTFWAVQPIAVGIVYFLVYYDHAERGGVYNIATEWLEELFVYRCEIYDAKEKK